MYSTSDFFSRSQITATDFFSKQVTATATSSPVSLSAGSRQIAFTIHNKSRHEINDTLRLLVDDSGFYRSKAVHVGAIPPFGKKTVRVELERAGGVTIDDLKKSTPYRLLVDVEGETATCSGRITWPMYFFKEGKHEWGNGFDGGFNILEFGVAGKESAHLTIRTIFVFARSSCRGALPRLWSPPGAGKSSWIQTVMTTLQDNDAGDAVLSNRLRVGGSSGHVTVDLRRHEVVEGVNLWDTWGMTTRNYQDAELRAMVQGQGSRR